MRFSGNTVRSQAPHFQHMAGSSAVQLLQRQRFDAPLKPVTNFRGDGTATAWAAVALAAAPAVARVAAPKVQSRMIGSVRKTFSATPSAVASKLFAANSAPADPSTSVSLEAVPVSLTQVAPLVLAPQQAQLPTAAITIMAPTSAAPTEPVKAATEPTAPSAALEVPPDGSVSMLVANVTASPSAVPDLSANWPSAAATTSSGLTAPPAEELSTAVPAPADAQSSDIAAWSADWRAAATVMPCGSCTGRACSVCSIRTGGPAKNGQPSGYAPRVLQYYDQGTDTVGGSHGVTSTSLLEPGSGDTDTATTSSSITASNAIVLENQLQGTPESEWLIDAGDPTIEGYAAQFSINHGQTVDFKINTDSTDYRIEIYRLGYYGGDGARRVATIEKDLTTAQVQPVPLFDPETRLVDAGNWSVSASWAIPADAVSGVYFAKLTRFDGSGGENMIPFIVRDDENPSDITFQTSDTTWQAYNWWGGYNFYGGIDVGGHAGRAYKVSYNRPIITRDGGFAAGPQDFIFGAEYPAIRWLEQNGYDINYITGIDTARDGAQLLNGKAFLSIGHDEYWSADQRDNVEAARDAGVNLAFLSGNEVYWETRWETSIDGTGTPYKTLVSYKERWANADIDPEGTTSTWRDPVLGSGEPENALTGTIFTVDSYRLDTITIPYDLSNFRFWSNTAVADIQPGQVYSLTKNLLGYEWDSDLDNGSRPDGLIALSSTTVEVEQLLLDYGNTTGPGTASHSLTLYRAPSGALVFGAGTVYWVWGLDDNHDNEPTPVDVNVQQAMVNLFAEMGIQPSTLMASLQIAEQTTDNLAPTSLIDIPNGGGTYVAAQPIVISGTATDAGGGIVAVVEVSTDGGQTWRRATGYNDWTYSWTPLAGGTYTITSRAVDDSVNLEVPGAGQTINVGPAATASLFAPNSTPAVLSDRDTRFVSLGVHFTASQAGSIVALKYYKGIGDGGTHVGSLWTATGTLLASATFTGETESGWQTVSFANPVSIAAGTTYVASYNSQGGYAATSNYFTTAHTSGPLTAPAGNGYFLYGTGSLFPTQASGGTNYWIDVVFSAANQANEPPSGTNDDGYVLTNEAPTTFTAASLLANDTDPNGDPLTVSGVGAASGGSVSFDSQTNIITFTPDAGYTGPATFGYAISDGRGGVGSAFVNMTVVAPASGVSLFSTSNTPAVASTSDTSQVNLGVKFAASTAGSITGIRYYKSANDVGTHTGTLWTSTGTLLGTVTFVNESASGWQTATFSNPIAITAGTTYVASYHSNGRYPATGSYFTSPYVNGQLSTPANAGVYTYGTSNLFPTSTFNATNYWVDVLFMPEGGINYPPTAVDDDGFVTTQNTALNLAAATLLANDSDPERDPLAITGVSGATNGTVSFDPQADTVTFTPTAGYSGAASFTYAVSDGSGNTSNANVSLTVNATPNEPPVATNDTGLSAWQDTSVQITAASILANDTDPNGDTLVVTGVRAPTNGTVAFDAQANVITFTPTAGYTGPAGFTYDISDGRGGTSSAGVALSITAPPAGSGVFAANATPATISVNDPKPVELGMKFTVSVGGTVTGIRFYKGPTNTGTHTGSLWTATGTLLGTLTFSNETASGWQTAAFASPISISAGTTYVVSYHTNGNYSADGNYFAAAVTNGPVTGLSNAQGGNGVYAYGPGAFPTNSHNASNYWVDVLFNPAANEPPTASGDSGFTTQQDTTLGLAAASLLANDTDPNGDALTITEVSAPANGTVAFDAQTDIVTFTPNAGYTGPASFTYTIADGRGGTSSADVALTVSEPATGVSLFAPSAAPATITVNDPNSVELGMKFTSSTDGSITGMRFYKGPQNVGTHTGTLWSASGTALGTLTFQNETASGWQSASFATPIDITAGATYVVSYHSNGHYSATGNGFGSAVTSGPLTAPSSASSGGNGVYAYGSASAFPTNSYNATNYYVDVIFDGQLAS